MSAASPTAPPEPAGEDVEPPPGWRLGSVGGVPVYLAKSWFVIAAVIVLIFGPDIGRALPRLGAGTAYLLALVYAVLLALSVLAHEAAHAMVARACGYQVHRIVANLWGGHTSFTRAAPGPGRSALVSVAGPLANVLLAVVGFVVLPYVGPVVARLLVYAWAMSNAFVAAFNLLPGLPLDGGFLVEALVWRLSGRRSLGLIVGGWGGRLVTVAALGYLVVIPLLRGDTASLWNVAWFAFIGAFLWAGASAAITTGKAMSTLERLPLSRLVRPVLPVPAGTPISALPGHTLAGATGPQLPVPVLLGADGLPAGLLAIEAIPRLSATEREAPVEALLVAMPPAWVVPAPDPAGTLAPVLPALLESPVGVVVLCDATGRPVGLLTSGDAGAAVDGGPERAA